MSIFGDSFPTFPQWGGGVKCCIETYSLVKFMFWLVVADEKVRLDWGLLKKPFDEEEDAVFLKPEDLAYCWKPLLKNEFIF
jgi:hypothetical protein